MYASIYHIRKFQGANTMPRLGIMQCTRCQLRDMQKEADFRNMTISIRKSIHSFAGKPGLDIYIHPKNFKIPGNFQFWHNGEPGSEEFLGKVLLDNDPQKWWHGWIPEICDTCMCREASEMRGAGINSQGHKKLNQAFDNYRGGTKK